jgi:hypothetical protein
LETIVSVEDLSFSYGGAFKLNSISLNVSAGTVLTLLGPNGCGKTTLLKCINALLKPESGRVVISGRNAHELRRWELARLVGYVPQTHVPPIPLLHAGSCVDGKNGPPRLLSTTLKSGLQDRRKGIEYGWARSPKAPPVRPAEWWGEAVGVDSKGDSARTEAFTIG